MCVALPTGVMRRHAGDVLQSIDMPGFRQFIAVILLSAPLASQPAAPAFEVASVKAVEDGKTWAVRKVDAQLYRSVSNVMQTVMWAWKV
jgi:hypothetical protein